MRLCKLLAFAALLLAPAAHAGGPRWYTGIPYYTVTPGLPVAFFTPDVTYFTDPGALNASVSHAQADAMVTAAAAVWNVPTARLTLKQGGVLAEHLSSSNVFFDGQQMVFPGDVKLANYHAIPIAIIYDTDGSVIDTLLGSGASSPSGCLTNGVVEDVDGLDPLGTIDHAILILNGRCVGSAPAQLTQMQYQLMRAFGRVLGLAWSQVNDNIFTGASTPNAAQMANWPVMHPIDVICGAYTYQCMQNPFSLRVDDLSALAMLYPVTASNIIAGKTLSQSGAASQSGWVRFPTGQGMDAVNVVLQRQPAFQQTEPALLMSAVTGANHRQYAGNLVSGLPEGPSESCGEWWGDHEGYYFFQRIPIVGPYEWDTFFTTSEPINSLYNGDYAISGYVGQPPRMSGSTVTVADGLVSAVKQDVIVLNHPDAAANCSAPPAGNEFLPITADSTGWWTGLICGGTQASWIAHTALPGRSWTLEVTALDESGAASNLKLFPVIGVFKDADPTGTAPTVSSTAAPFNGIAPGMTQLRMSAGSSQQTYRITITDLRGSTRPDYTYKARLLYADSVTPSQVGRSGGLISISGEGFRTVNVVKVNGINATVLSWAPNQILAITPSMTAANMTATTLADVTVLDPGTGGITTVQSALSYGGVDVNLLQLVSAPSALETGIASNTAFSVRVLLSDGVTPARGASVKISASGVGAVFTACAAATCTLIADANGIVQSNVTATAAGTLTLAAVELSGGATVQAVVLVTDPVRLLVALTVDHYIAPSVADSWSVDIAATLDGIAAAGLPIQWSASAGLALNSTSTLTGSDGHSAANVTTNGLGAGNEASVQACAWIAVCVTTRIVAIDPALWVVHVDSGAGQSVPASKKLSPVVILVTDAAGHPIESAAVTVAQTVDAWEGTCPATGRCASAPVLTSSRNTYMTGADGKLSITPLEMAGLPSVVNIAVIAGTNGFVSLSLMKTP